MKKFIYAYFLGAMLILSAPVFAENHAANISISSDGRGVDNDAINTLRNIIGEAIGNETVDTFIVYSPRMDGPIFIEGGISVCAEAGFSATEKQLEKLLKQLGAIHPKSGSFMNVEFVTGCEKK
ncbi:MAG: hypothetical protein ABL903_11715 [Methylococcales bacterium]